MLSAREITKKTETKAITRVKIGRTQKIVAKTTMREMQDNRGCRNSSHKMHNAGAGNSVAGTKFLNAPFFFSFCSSFLLGSDLQR